MLILGRSTAQWSGLYAGLASFIALALPTLFPGQDWARVQTVIAASVGLVGLFIAFLANSSLTPVADPRLEVGSTVNAGLHNEAMVVKKVATIVAPEEAVSQPVTQG